MIRRLTLNPVAILYIVNALIAMAITWGVHLSAHQTGAIDTVVTGVLTIAAAFLVRPPEIAVAASAAVTVLTAFSAFGLHYNADRIASTVAVASIFLAFVLHQSVIPNVAARQGKTAQQLLLERG